VRLLQFLPKRAASARRRMNVHWNKTPGLSWVHGFGTSRILPQTQRQAGWVSHEMPSGIRTAMPTTLRHTLVAESTLSTYFKTTARVVGITMPTEMEPSSPRGTSTWASFLLTVLRGLEVIDAVTRKPKTMARAAICQGRLIVGRPDDRGRSVDHQNWC
jgi:hypothetical protein